MMRLVPLMFVMHSILVTIHSQVADPSNNSAVCCNSKCGTQVLPGPLKLQEVVNESPNYAQVTTTTVYSSDHESLCYTYLKTVENSYMMFSGLRHTNGSCKIERYIASSLAGYSGVIRYTNPARNNGSCTFIYDHVYLGNACSGLRVYYRNYFQGPCVILGNISLINADFIHGESSSRDISECCKSQVAAVANSRQLRVPQLVELPNQLNRCCVTQFNGASCVNADRVLPQDSVSVNV